MQASSHIGRELDGSGENNDHDDFFLSLGRRDSDGLGCVVSRRESEAIEQLHVA